MPRRYWFVIAGLLALGHQTAAHAFIWPRCPVPPRPYPPQNLPPLVLPPTYLPGPGGTSAPQPPLVLPPTYLPAPGSPMTADPANPNPPVNPPTPAAPVQPPPAAVPPGGGADMAAGNEFLGGQGAGTFSPNMFGDFFGGTGNLRLNLRPSNVLYTLNGQVVFSPTTTVSSSSSGDVQRFSPNAAGAYIEWSLRGYPGISRFKSNGLNAVLPFDQLVPNGGSPGPVAAITTPFTVSPATTNIFSQVLARLQNTPEGRAALLGAVNSLFSPSSGVILTRADSLTLGQSGVFDGRGAADLLYTYQLLAGGLQTVPFELGIAVANPTSGGMVGRTKVSEDNNPFPRDRLIFNYDYYSATRLTADGTNVNRFSAGMETTFLDRRGSLEVRVPFASTLDSMLVFDGATGTNLELGNVAIAGKWLWTRDPYLNFASGLSAALPTADDTIVALRDGTELIRVKNTSVLLTPYVAMSYTPNDRFFAQGWASGGIDAFGNDVNYRNLVDGTVRTQRIYDLPVLSLDAQIGYWLARSNDSAALLQGLAPFIELHYNRAFDVARASANFGGVRVIEARPGFDDVNMTVGFTAQLRNNLSVSNGLVVPLGERDNRFFDWQYGLRMNMFYGPTARTTDAAMAAIRAQAAAADTTPGVLPVLPPPNTFSQGKKPKGDVVAVGYSEPVLSPMQQTLASSCGVCLRPETPPFFGDFIGVGGQRTIATATGPQTVRLPIIPAYAGLKVTDNDGPRPSDRFYFTYNHFAGAFANQNPPGFQDIEVSRETVGFEKTIFGGYGSFGMRLPFIQSSGPAATDSAIGDLTLVTKLAWAQDDATGSLISSGVNLTLPTGTPGDIALLNNGAPAPRSLWLQPWTGFLYNHDRLYTQGVVSLAAPSEGDYPVELFTSIGAGYWLVRGEGEGVRGLIPTVELHVNTPLTNRGAGRRVTVADEASVTTGLNLLLPRMTIGGAVSVPVLGRSAYDLEALMTLNFRY